MKTENINIKKTIRIAVLPLAISMALASTAVAETIPSTANPQEIIKKYDSKNILPTHRQVVKEAADTFNATEIALNALQNNQPKQALAALKIVSDNVDLLLARNSALDMIPIDIQVQVLEGVTQLKRIKKLEDELDDLIDNGHFQAARPIVDSLVDELRVTTTYLPLTAYPIAINNVAPLIEAGKLDEAEMELITALDTFVIEEEITPLAIIRAEERLTEAFQLKSKGDFSKQETRDKIKRLLKEAEHHVKVAETLGYGTKKDYERIYHGIHTLHVEVRREGINSEWAEIKQSISGLKNKIVHTRK